MAEAVAVAAVVAEAAAEVEAVVVVEVAVEVEGRPSDEVELRHEGVVAAVAGRVEGARGRREVDRVVVPGQVGAAGAVERDAVAGIVPPPPR